MRRPETARDEAHVRLAAGAEGRLEVGRVVADDEDPVGDEAERQRLAGVERPVAVRPFAAHELAARDDDRRAGAAHPETVVAPETLSRPLGLRSSRRPSTFTTTFFGFWTERKSAFFVNRWS